MGSPKGEQEGQHENGNNQDAGQPPPPPEPSKDTGIIPRIQSPGVEALDALEQLTIDNIDIFTLDPVAALKLLCRGTQALCDMTGDVPPTPMLQGHSYGSPPAAAEALAPKQSHPLPGFSSRNDNDHIDGVPFTRTPIGSPEAHMGEPIVHGSSAQPAAVQYAALVRKFYSKRPPPISLEDYLSRMHKYCPMSTAVYLATSHYITHLAVQEKICPVTPRNVHRLVLAGLRIAMKALEDLSWPHGRFAKVGGISEPELARLEIGFCFLMNFGLKVDAQMLTEEAKYLLQMSNSSAVADDFGGGGNSIALTMPDLRKKKTQQQTSDNGNDGEATSGTNGSLTPRSTAEKRKASSSLPFRATNHVGPPVEIVGQG